MVALLAQVKLNSLSVSELSCGSYQSRRVIRRLLKVQFAFRLGPIFREPSV